MVMVNEKMVMVMVMTVKIKMVRTLLSTLMRSMITNRLSAGVCLTHQTAPMATHDHNYAPLSATA